MSEILVFDTETDGLPKHKQAPLDQQPRILEFGGVFLSPEDGEITEEFSILINPGVPIPAEATKINGITDEMVADALTFGAALPQIEAIFERAGIVFAHNLPFDKGMIHFELARLGATSFPWPEREICTVGHYYSTWGRRPKLTELFEYVTGRELKQDHRALSDVFALAEIIKLERLWM
jgi:DNA polymerase III epsilon subunit-like protein